MAYLPLVPVDCTPGTVLAEIPCLQCEGQGDLDKLIMLAWAYANGYTLPDDLETLIADSQCWNCTSDSQKKQAEFTAMAARVMQEVEPGIVAALQCFRCLTPGQVKAITALMKCQFWGNYLRVR